ncbi:STI1/HOP DP domain-containing protein [Plasmodiophora brassicae]|uniref:STI1/HOP DP domain-containing protein n=1 Tax=Plasmodiophora brassicae TaxID=37360 RepID=A0A0G4ILN5_PLABS|nr:secrectory protein [Plasmodiophora brassicae]CEO96073.1 hypothetical protein PBRA_004763 [Plasmodiophora brassicae]
MRSVAVVVVVVVAAIAAVVVVGRDVHVDEPIAPTADPSVTKTMPHHDTDDVPRSHHEESAEVPRAKSSRRGSALPDFSELLEKAKNDGLFDMFAGLNGEGAETHTDEHASTITELESALSEGIDHLSKAPMEDILHHVEQGRDFGEILGNPNWFAKMQTIMEQTKDDPKAQSILMNAMVRKIQDKLGDMGRAEL